MANRPTEHIAPSQQKRSDDTKLALLEAAVACFIENGVAATNTTMISERAGVSRGAYLHHFKSRDVLIAAAIDYTQRLAIDRIEESIRALFDAPSVALFHQIWSSTMLDSFFPGYEMMLMARHNDALRAEWQFHSDALKARRIAVLETLFSPEIARTAALPLLEGISDFFRGLKVMSIVRTEEETALVINASAPVFVERLTELLHQTNR